MAGHVQINPGTSKLRLVESPEEDRDTGSIAVELRDGCNLPSKSGFEYRRRFLELARTLSAANSATELIDQLAGYFARELGAYSLELITTPSGDVVSIEQARIAALASEHLEGKTVARFRIDDDQWVSASLMYRDSRYGVLAVGFHDAHSIDEDALALIELAAFTAAGELARMIDFRTVEEHLSDLNFIRALDREIAQARDLPAMADIVRSQFGGAIESTFCALLVANSDGTELDIVAYRNEFQSESSVGRVPVEGSRVGGVYRSGKPVVIGNVLEDDQAYSRESANWRSLMIAPLIGGDQIFGTLMIGHKLPDFYDERDLRIVELVSSQIANAIYRFLGEEREHSQHLAAIEALSAAVDARDPFTHTHSRRVADLAHRVARELGLPEIEASQIELAGLLHDIGKIGIPDRILTKPGRLDAEEQLFMMNHSEMGARIIGRSSALSHLVPVVRHHHEWYDGRGYPDGLRGDEIPLGAAILGVVDALETMTSNRVYRRALSLDDAQREIERGRGGQFHPDVADVVLRLLDTDPTVIELIESAPEAWRATGSLAPIRSSDVVALRVLNRIAEEIGALTELPVFLNHVHSIVREELEFEDVLIWLQDEKNGKFSLAAGISDLVPPGQLRPFATNRQKLDTSDSGYSVLTRDDGVDQLERSFICPMFVEDNLVGLIELVLRKPGSVDDRDIDLVQAIAAPVASTIRVAQLHDEAKRAAMTDGLTGVLNHRAFYQELDRRIGALGENEELHLLIVDVIGLKAINDNYGHIAGDHVLRTVASELVSRLRDDDIVSRYGGDEFAAILRGPLHLPVEEIVERMERPVPCEIEPGISLSLHLRCGHAATGAHESRATELVARADALLYARVRPTERNLSNP